MSPRISKFFAGDRKYFTIVFFILVLIILSAFITPKLIEGVEGNWEERLNTEIERIERSVVKQFREEEELLLNKSAELNRSLRKAFNPGSTSYGNIIDIVNSREYEELAVEIYAPNGRLIGWNKNAPVLQGLPFPLAYKYGETYFSSQELMTWLSVIDTIDFENEHFYIITHSPFQKHYRIQNPYYKEVDFTKTISNRLLTT
jgi:hypothetical protein